MRKLILLALGGAAAAYVMKGRGEQPVAEPVGGGYAPGPESAAEAPAVEEVKPGPEEERAEAAAIDTTADTTESDAIDPSVRFDQTENAPTGEGVVPDTSDDDPLVRQQENAAAAEAGSVGGEPGSVTADADPEMRPVVEGSGDAQETFEETEDQGR
jgi:hypothetical protein